MYGTETFYKSREIISSFQGINCSMSAEPKSTQMPHRQIDTAVPEVHLLMLFQALPVSDIFTIID